MSLPLAQELLPLKSCVSVKYIFYNILTRCIYFIPQIRNDTIQKSIIIFFIIFNMKVVSEGHQCSICLIKTSYSKNSNIMKQN